MTPTPSVELLKEKFEGLVKNQFLIRNASAKNRDKDKPDKPTKDIPEYDLPVLNINALNQIIRGEEADAGDNKIYWRINFDRLIQDMR